MLGAVPAEPGEPVLKISFKMSPNPPLLASGAGWGAWGAAFPDPLRISPEMTIPASTGSSFLSTNDVTPESCCA